MFRSYVGPVYQVVNVDSRHVCFETENHAWAVEAKEEMEYITEQDYTIREKGV